MRLTPEEEERWDKAMREASEFELRRYECLEGPGKLRVLCLIPAGEAATLGEAVTMADGSFEDFMRRNRS